MCEHGDMVTCLVPVPPELSHSGKLEWKQKSIDSCISGIINALNAQGIYTANSCCGHGKRDGEIILHEGRTLFITNGESQARRAELLEEVVFVLKADMDFKKAMASRMDKISQDKVLELEKAVDNLIARVREEWRG